MYSMNIKYLQSYFDFGTRIALIQSHENENDVVSEAVVLTMFGLTAINCGKSDSNNPAPVIANGQYYMNASGQCISATGQIAPSPTYCTNTTNNGYMIGANGQCVSTTTGQIAPSPTYCTNGGMPGTGMPGSG